MEQDLRLIAMAINGVMTSTQPICHNFQPTSFYYVYDVFETFAQRTSSKLTLAQFFHLLKKVECAVVLEGCDAGMSIVCLRPHFDKNKGLQILSNDTKAEDDVQADAAGDMYDNISEDSDNVVIQAVGGKNISPKKSRRVAKKSIEKMQEKKQGGVETNKDGPTSKQINEQKEKTYQDTRKRLLDAFGDGVIVPTSALHMAFIRTHGFAFEYKKLPCKNGYHTHGSLSKYISCCKDAFEIKSFVNLYIKRVDYDANILVERRKKTHISQLTVPVSKYHLELLLVDMFPTKVSVEYSDLIHIFNEVYDVNLSSLCCGDPKKVIYSLGTPNIYFTHNNKTMVTLVPSWTSSYKDFGDSNKVLQAIALDTSIFAKRDTVPVEANESNTHTGIYNRNHNVEDVLGSSSHLLDIAGSNVPRCLQVQHASGDTLSFFKLCDKDDGLCLQWGYVNQYVRLNSKNAFFDIN